MKSYIEMTKEELQAELQQVKSEFEAYKAKGLKLNMARGKPGNEQVSLSMGMMDVLTSKDSLLTEDGMDCRNYGELSGIVDAKKLFGRYMGVQEDEIFIGGSSSLAIMYDSVARALLTGVLGSERPWAKEERVKFLCPVPGYDRHFAICEFLDIEMINVPTYEDGPDMDMIEKLVAEDASIKGMWCVPKFSNPLGITFSDEVIRRMAALKPAAKDFRVFCDNAYAYHHIYKDVPLLNILEAFKQAGNPNMLFLFGSTNKLTFPGAGVGFIAASKENIDFITKQLSIQAIGWDKLNMLRHVRFLKDMDGIKAHMEKQAEVMRIRFDIVIKTLEEELVPRNVGSFVKPQGGYFVTYYAPQNCAKRIVSLCKEGGVIMTDAGATHPYGKDPEDSVIRIAPSFPSAEELESAMQVFSVASRLAYIEKLL